MSREMQAFKSLQCIFVEGSGGFNVRTTGFTLIFLPFSIFYVNMDMLWEWLRISIWNCSPLEAEKLTDALVRAQGGLESEAVWQESSAALRCLVKKGGNSGMGEKLSPVGNQIKLTKRTGVNSCFLVQFPLSWWDKSLKLHFPTNAHFLSFGYLTSTCGATGGSDKLSHSSTNQTELCSEYTLYTAKYTGEKSTNRLTTSPKSFQN